MKWCRIELQTAVGETKVQLKTSAPLTFIFHTERNQLRRSRAACRTDLGTGVQDFRATPSDSLRTFLFGGEKNQRQRLSFGLGASLS